MSLILEAVKKALTEGEATVNLKEASTLTASGSGVGGLVIYDDAFAALCLANPIRMMSRVINTIGSDEAFVVKKGNATVIQTSTTNPWNYDIKSDVGNDSVAFWQISAKCINATVPVRTAVLSDVNALDESIVQDIALEFAQQEALSMMLNNDQSTGTATPQTGSTYGLRGLNFYPGSTTAAAFGANGSGVTNGVHTILQVQQATATTLVYDDIVNLSTALPPQYWGLPGTAWHMHPSYISQIRQYAHGGGGYSLVETGEMGEGPAVNILGFPVIPNPYLDPTGTAGNFPVYLANWPRFMTIADVEEMTIQMMEQSAPGFVTMYAEKRMVSTVRDPFAGVRLIET